MLSPEPKNCRNRYTHTSKIGKLLPVVSQTTGVEVTAFLSRIKNLAEIGKELWT